MYRILVGLLLSASLGVGGCAPKAVEQQPAERTSAKSTSAVETFPLLARGRLVDLTYAFDENTIYWPTEKGFQLEVASRGLTDRGYFYSANRFTTAEHGGTHIDAPIHFHQDRDTVDTIPLERLVGEGVLVDVSEACVQNADYQVSVADLRAWEVKQDQTLGDAIVLLRTGHGRLWNDRKSYLGTDRVGPEAVDELHFPGLEPDAAKWLSEQRSIRAVGIDTPSIDYGQSRMFQSHVTLFEHNIPAIENVANLDELPASGFAVIALPMKIRGGSGGPTRVIAVLPE